MGQAKLLYHERVFPYIEAANGVSVFENLFPLSRKVKRQLRDEGLQCSKGRIHFRTAVAKQA